eukprot:CAMPEP_0195513674 /NCGR_PEP_ID=MMETSP0794_2-20130614/5273_1 /TAXON_ID=515487 /ORGANISM="Stephanopyxis turris, Strain CCMP 815" /LENGTH=298 /DNA_ID=CAMNT_0040641743 /DNA_START=197 /DNA_END=1093 /DNA_ORIENTATION=-
MHITSTTKQPLKQLHTRVHRQMVVSMKNRRCLASNSKTGSEPISISAPSFSGDASQEAAAKRTEKLFDDLNALMEKHEAQKAAEAAIPFTTKVGRFIRASKHQLINIAAGFTCFFLAVQVANSRIEERKLTAKLKETNKKMENMYKRIDALKSEQFGTKTAEKCARSIQDSMNDASRGSSKGGGFFVYRTFGGKQMRTERNITEEADNVFVQTVSAVIQNEIRQLIGDARLQQHELEEKEMLKLRSFMVGASAGTSGESSSVDLLNPAAKDLVAAVEKEETNQEDGDVKVIKKRKMMF